MKLRSLNAVNLSALTGISNSQFSRWKNGLQTSISEDDFSALATALSTDAEDHARLLRAHLEDERFGPGAELITIELISNGEMQDRARPQTKLESAWQFLHSQTARNSDLRALIIDLAKALGMEDKP